MSEHFDAIVIGLGGMGSSTCYHLAKRGIKTLGIEQFSLGHDKGSSHGETRVIRKAYFEHPDYIPLLNRAYELWEDLEKESGNKLLTQCGIVTYGDPKTSSVYKGILESAEKYKIPIEQLSHKDALKRWPVYSPPENFCGIYEPSGGFLYSDECMITHAKLARKLGAELKENEKLIKYSGDNTEIRIETDKGKYTANKIIFTSGSWAGELLRDLKIPLKIKQKFHTWFPAQREHSIKHGVPCFAFQTEESFFYGLPSLDQKTFKIADHLAGEFISEPPHNQEVKIPTQELKIIQNLIKRCFPFAETSLSKQIACLYTNTPDEHFIIDKSPKNPNILIAAGFSGHGFKFSSVVGEILAELCEAGKTKHPIELFRLSRF